MKFPAPVRPDKIMSFTVDENAGELRLIDFLAEKLPQCKRTGLKQMLAHRQVKVAGNIVSQATRPLAGGEEVMVNLTREFREFYHRRLRIVHEDDHIIVIHKGYGLLSMADDSARNVETAYSILRDYLKKEHPSNKLFIVHRLDRDTSGLMLFAKTIEAKETLQHNWNNMVLERKYLCVVEGTPRPGRRHRSQLSLRELAPRSLLYTRRIQGGQARRYPLSDAFDQRQLLAGGM